MALKARIFEAILYRIAVVLLVCVLSGCGSQSAQLPTYMRPELLYLSHQPYSHLYVEVDTIEGIEVPDQWLDELKAFLGKYCFKPDGIEIVRDKPVPISEIEGLPFGLASIMCIDGPDPSMGQQPAYLHVFFYETDLVFKRIMRNTHVPALCPCAIFFNVDYAGRWYRFTIKHEAGHVLGLCKKTTHGNGTHCRNYGCLMCATPDLLSQLGSLVGSSPDGQLCADCKHDLDLWKSEDAGSNLVFKGPFLIRREDGYSVASLPYCDLIIPAPVESVFDWKDALSHIKNKMKEAYRITLNEDRESKKVRWYVRGLYGLPNENASPESVTDKLSILTRAADDPCPLVKSYAIAELKELKEKEKQKR